MNKRSQIPRFLQVGAIGFAIDAGGLWLGVYVFDWPPLWARAFSFALTIAVTFVLNARYTFKASIRESNKRRYVAIQGFGAAINFLSYTVLITAVAWHLWPMVALTISAALASTHNFFMMRRFVFVAATSGIDPAAHRSTP